MVHVHGCQMKYICIIIHKYKQYFSIYYLFILCLMYYPLTVFTTNTIVFSAFATKINSNKHYLRHLCLRNEELKKSRLYLINFAATTLHYQSDAFYIFLALIRCIKRITVPTNALLFYRCTFISWWSHP